VHEEAVQKNMLEKLHVTSLHCPSIASQYRTRSIPTVPFFNNEKVKNKGREIACPGPTSTVSLAGETC